MLMAQARHQQQKAKRMAIARSIIEGAAHNMLKNLIYYKNRGKDIAHLIDRIKSLAQLIETAGETDTLMGIEGNIRNTYYDAFDVIINDFDMGKRSRQPPLNEVNALISFGNMMCYSQVLRSIHQTQLNPTISFLHSPGERRYSLALDVAEIFKPILIDRVIFKVLNKKEVQRNDFESGLNRVLLKEKGRKTFISAFENRLNETFLHKSLNKHVSYKHLIKLECYKLQKHLLGIEGYKAFKMNW